MGSAFTEVFGMCNTSESPALGYMELVDSRNVATLLPIIQAHVNPGTTIYSDCWAACNRVITLPSVQAHCMHSQSLYRVCHSDWRAHKPHRINWNRVKTKIKRMRGCHRSQLPSYINKFMWRERYGTTRDDVLTSIYRDISLWYPV